MALSDLQLVQQVRTEYMQGAGGALAVQIVVQLLNALEQRFGDDLTLDRTAEALNDVRETAGKMRERLLLSQVYAYLAEKQAKLRNGYMHRIGVKEIPIRVAREVAGLLLKAGKQPHVLRITGPDGEEVTFRKGIFGEGVTWDAHEVCCVGNDVFDPLHGKSLPLMEFLTETFEGIRGFGEEKSPALL